MSRDSRRHTFLSRACATTFIIVIIIGFIIHVVEAFVEKDDGSVVEAAAAAIPPTTKSEGGNNIDQTAEITIHLTNVNDMMNEEMKGIFSSACGKFFRDKIPETACTSVQTEIKSQFLLQKKLLEDDDDDHTSRALTADQLDVGMRIRATCPASIDVISDLFVLIINHDEGHELLARLAAISSMHFEKLETVTASSVSVPTRTSRRTSKLRTQRLRSQVVTPIQPAPESKPATLPPTSTVPPTVQPITLPTTFPPTTSPPIFQPKTTLQNNDDVLLCNGSEQLCDVVVNEVLFGTLHNAMATKKDGYLILPNHKKSFGDALQAGFRGLNFDIGRCKGKLTFVHGICALGTIDMIESLETIQDFLNANPNEVILMPTQIDNDAGTFVGLEAIYEVFQNVPGWVDRMYEHPGNSNSPWPTLRELIASDKRILFFHYNSEESCPCPPGFHQWFDYAIETRYSFKKKEDLANSEFSCTVTRGLSGTRDFFGVNVFPKLPNQDFSAKVNEYDFLQQHLADCSSLNDDQIVNAVLVDFWSAGDVISVVEEYNDNTALG